MEDKVNSKKISLCVLEKERSSDEFYDIKIKD